MRTTAGCLRKQMVGRIARLCRIISNSSRHASFALYAPPSKVVQLQEPLRGAQPYLDKGREGDIAMKTGERWKNAHFGRPEDQPLILALLIILIALTLYFFL